MTTSYCDELRNTGKLIFTIKGVSMRPLFRTDEDAIFVVACNPEELKNKVIEEIKSKYPKYTYDVIIDSDYSD